MNSPAPPSRFPALNGVRAIALAWVIFVHLPSFAVPSFMMGAHHRWRFGVDFFFAISGFLVTRSLFQCFTARNGVTPTPREASFEYLTRRFARILPPYYLVLAVIGTMAVIFRGGLLENLKEISAILPSFPLLFANYTIPASLHEVPIALEILWSVSFQEQFYLLLLLVFALAPKHFTRTLLMLASASIAMRIALAFGPWKGLERSGHYEFWLHLNFDSLAWGCLAWIYYDRLGVLWSTPTRARWVGVALILGNALSMSAPSFWESGLVYPLSSVLKAPVFALTVRWFCELEKGKSLLVRFLRLGWLGKIGNASYEIYLTHVIVFGFLDKLGVNEMVPFLALAYGTSTAVGMAFFHLYSVKVQAWMKKWLRSLFGGRVPKPAIAQPALSGGSAGAQ